jgi:hypothetical protein
MGEYERNKGRLCPLGVSTINFSEEDFDKCSESGYVVIRNMLYRVEWSIRKDQSYDGFADVKINNDGSIDFHTHHDNGGAHWTELVEDALGGAEQ